MQTASDTPFDSYLDVQNRIAQAFDDIRTHLAQRQFGKPYGELSDAQRQVVHAGRSAEDFRSRTPRFPIVEHPAAARWQLAGVRYPAPRIAASDRRQTAFRPPLFRIATPDRRQPTHG